MQGPPQSIEVIMLSSESESEELVDAARWRERRARRTEASVVADASATPSSTRRNNGADSVRGGVAVRQHTPRAWRGAQGGAGTGDAAKAESVGLAPGGTGSGYLGFGPGALRKRNHADALGSTASGGAALDLPTTLIEVKQELADDGGWPTEYQTLPSQPYDKSDYDELHRHYFTPPSVTAAGAGDSAVVQPSPKAVGDFVEANYMGLGTYHGGIIKTQHPDGTFAIAYHDGDYEENVERANIRALRRRRRVPRTTGLDPTENTTTSKPKSKAAKTKKATPKPAPLRGVTAAQRTRVAQALRKAAEVLRNAAIGPLMINWAGSGQRLLDTKVQTRSDRAWTFSSTSHPAALNKLLLISVSGDIRRCFRLARTAAECSEKRPW